MRVPFQPPDVKELLPRYLGAGRHHRIVKLAGGPMPGNRYVHWDQLRHRSPPEGLTREEWWLGIKLARTPLFRPIPLRSDKGEEFVLAVPEAMQELLQQLDDETRGNEVFDAREPSRDVLINALMEEAVHSAQLDGAALGRAEAKRLLRDGEVPTDRSGWLVEDTFEGLVEVVGAAQAPLTPETVLDLHRVMSAHTVYDGSAGRLRDSHELPDVPTQRGVALFDAPIARELHGRLARLCDFANGAIPGAFMHPLVRASAVHLWVMYERPFVEGAGRVARALALWTALLHGYPMLELLPVSRLLRRDKAAYERALLYTVSDAGDATYFVQHLLLALEESVTAYEGWAWRRRGELARIRRHVQDPGLSERQLVVLSDVMHHPEATYTLRHHQARFGVAYDTARRDLNGLARRGLLVRRRGGRFHVYAAGAVERLAAEG